MRVWDKITVLLCIVMLALGGVYSLVHLATYEPPMMLAGENRAPATSAPFTMENLQSGDYTQALENTYTDSFPGRSYWLKINEAVELAQMALAGGQQYVGGDFNMNTDPNNNANDPEMQTIEGGFYYAKDTTGVDRIMYSYNENESTMAVFADAVNAMSAPLTADGRWVGVMQVPGSFGVYAPAKLVTEQNNQTLQIEHTAALFTDAVDVDVVKALRAQAANNKLFDTAQSLYYPGDHHWTIYGAYVAYVQLCEAWGLEPMQLSQMQRGFYGNFQGYYYNYLKDKVNLDALRRNPSLVDYYIAPTEVHAQAFSDAALTGGWDVALVKEAEMNGLSGGYDCFGDDWAVLRVTTNANCGRRLLIAKDSYTNALLSLLVTQFDEIVAIDYRKLGGDGQPPLSMTELARRMDATHVLICVSAKVAHDPLSQRFPMIMP